MKGRRDPVQAITAAMQEHAKPKPDPMAALMRFAITDEQVNEMNETQLAYGGLVAVRHLAAWNGPAGSGKTAIAKDASREMASDGYRVLYFQEDAGAGDLPALHRHAKEHGYTLLNSTLAGGSAEDQIEVLRQFVKHGESLDGSVFFFDTLKKYCDLMSKGGTRAFFKLMRALTQMGATVILLGHTNKHRGPDGKLMFEGVGDVRNDVDELLYVDSTEKDAAGMVTITVKPDKVRSRITEATFQLDTFSGEMRRLDRVVDVATINDRQRSQREDAALIDEIRGALQGGGMNFTNLRDHVVKATGNSRRDVERVIGRHMSTDPADPLALWLETRLSTFNTRYVSLKPETMQ